MELELISACLLSRDSFEAIYPNLDLKTYSTVFAKVADSIRTYYERDPTARSINPDTLQGQVFLTLPNEKHRKMYADFLVRAVAKDVSAPNVAALLLGAKRLEAGRKLSEALVNQSEKKIGPLIEEYKTLSEAVEAPTAKAGVRQGSGIGSARIVDPRGFGDRLKLYPGSLGQIVEDGVGPGDHIVIFGEPEIGKSALAITFACGFLIQGAPGLWVENEEDFETRTQPRFRYCLSGFDKFKERENPDLVSEAAVRKGGELLRWLDVTGYGYDVIEESVKDGAKQEKPIKWLVVNQIHNIPTKSDNEVLRRERCAQAVRDLAKKYGLVGISITQGAESASNRLFLEMGDLYMSNTGVQGTCDLLIGIGADDKAMKSNIRGISFPKNKITNNHGNVPVRLRAEISRVVDI